MRNASIARRIAGICAFRSSGIGARFALYSAYASVRTVGASDIQRDAEQRRLLLTQQLAQHVDEAVDRVRRFTGRRRQAPDGVEGPEDRGVPVDQEEALGGHGATTLVAPGRRIARSPTAPVAASHAPQTPSRTRSHSARHRRCDWRSTVRRDRAPAEPRLRPTRERAGDRGRVHLSRADRAGARRAARPRQPGSRPAPTGPARSGPGLDRFERSLWAATGPTCG